MFIRYRRLLSPTVLRYFVSIAVIGFAVDGGVYSVLLNLFLIRLQYGPEMVGTINAVAMLAFAISSPLAGMFGERFGYRRNMLIGLCLLLISCLLLPLADLIPSPLRLVWLLANTIVIYLGLALYFVNTAPFLMEVIEAEHRNQIFSLQTAISSLAAFAGSLLGGFLPLGIGVVLGVTLDQPIAYRYSLMISGLAMIPAILSLRAARPTPVPPNEPRVAVNQNVVTVAAPIGGLVIAMALVRMLQVSGIATTSTFFNVYLDQALHVPTAQIGIIIAVARLLGVPAALATASLTNRFGNRAVVIGATLGTTLTMLPLAFIPHLGAASFGFVGVVGLSWIRYTSSLVYFLELVPPRKRATVVGAMEAASGLCFTLIAFGGGYIIKDFGYQWIFLLGALLTAASALIFWLVFRSHTPQPDPTIPIPPPAIEPSTME